jgi:hypothetical protein
MSHESAYVKVKYGFVNKTLGKEYFIWNTSKMKRKSETAKLFLHFICPMCPLNKHVTLFLSLWTTRWWGHAFQFRVWKPTYSCNIFYSFLFLPVTYFLLYSFSFVVDLFPPLCVTFQRFLLIQFIYLFNVLQYTLEGRTVCQGKYKEKADKEKNPGFVFTLWC